MGTSSFGRVASQPLPEQNEHSGAGLGADSIVGASSELGRSLSGSVRAGQYFANLYGLSTGVQAGIVANDPQCDLANFFSSEAFAKINQHLLNGDFSSVIEGIRAHFQNADNPTGNFQKAAAIRQQIAQANNALVVQDEFGKEVLCDALNVRIDDPKFNANQVVDDAFGSHDLASFDISLVTSRSSTFKTHLKSVSFAPESVKHAMNMHSEFSEGLASSPLTVLLLRAVHERFLADQLGSCNRYVLLAEPFSLHFEFGVAPDISFAFKSKDFNFSGNRGSGYLNVNDVSIKASDFKALIVNGEHLTEQLKNKDLPIQEYKRLLDLSNTNCAAIENQKNIILNKANHLQTSIKQHYLDSIYHHKLIAFEQVMTHLVHQLDSESLAKWVSEPVAQFMVWRAQNSVAAFSDNVLYWLIFEHSSLTSPSLTARNYKAALSALRNIHNPHNKAPDSSDNTQLGFELISQAAAKLSMLQNQINACTVAKAPLNSMGRAFVNSLLRDTVGKALGITTPKDLALFDLLCRTYKQRNLGGIRQAPVHSGLYNVLQNTAGFNFNASIEQNLEALQKTFNRTQLTPHLVRLLDEANRSSEEGLFEFDGEDDFK